MLARSGSVSSGRTRTGVAGRDDQAPASAATHLTAFAAGGTRFVGGPFVSSAFLVRSAPAFAGDLTLFLRGHRRKSSPFFSLSGIHNCASVFLCAYQRARFRTTYGPFWDGWGGGSSTRGGRGSSSGVSGVSSASRSRSGSSSAVDVCESTPIGWMPITPRRYQSLCPLALEGHCGKSLVGRQLPQGGCGGPQRRCSSLLQKGWSPVANDCKAELEP